MESTAVLRALLNRRVSRRLGPHVLAGLVLTLCLGMTFALWHSARTDAGDDVQADFDFRAREVMNKVALRMSAYIQVLRGVQGLYAASEDVTRKEFSAYVKAQNLDEHYPGVQAVSYVPLVSGEARAAHTAAVH